MVKIEVPTHLSSKEKKKLKEACDVLDDSHFTETNRIRRVAEAFYERKRKLEEE
jgi:hypothetical protein